MKKYTARARRTDDGWGWAIEIPELPGVFSQAKRLDLAEKMARDAIAQMLQVNPATVTVTVEPVLEDDLAKPINRLRALQAEQDRIQAETQTLASATTAELVKRGYRLRDAGRMMGLSFQRVHQLKTLRDTRPVKDAADDPSTTTPKRKKRGTNQ